jgi:hypothetical protein
MPSEAPASVVGVIQTMRGTTAVAVTLNVGGVTTSPLLPRTLSVL